jgi:hypothetical protein
MLGIGGGFWNKEMFGFMRFVCEVAHFMADPTA